MKRVVLFAIAIILITADQAVAQYKYRGEGTGVITSTDCSTYIAIGQLCQDTDDGKLYKGTGSAVEEVGSTVSDAELTALAGLTSAANAIPYFTGSGTAGVISSSADMVSLLGSADYATARTNLGTWGVSGSITDEQLVCGETTGGTNLLKSCGAKTTINAGNSTLLCKDSSGEVEACGGVTISGTTSPIVNVNPQEVDGHTTSTDLTAAQVSNTVIHNYDQAASDVFLIAPAAAAGYSALFTVITAQTNHWCFEAAANDKIYLIAADGKVAAGNDGAAVCMMAAQAGQSFACWTFKSGASSYDWQCKAISIGTSTFEAHASSE